LLSRCILLQDLLPPIYPARIDSTVWCFADRYALLITYGLLNRHYPTHELKRIPGFLDAPNIQILSPNGPDITYQYVTLREAERRTALKVCIPSFFCLIPTLPSYRITNSVIELMQMQRPMPNPRNAAALKLLCLVGTDATPLIVVPILLILL